MTTTLDIEDTLWKKIDGSSLKTTITGKIRKGERPANSDKEDIVVNCLPAGNNQLQLIVPNVNIYAPDITIQENGVQEKVADRVRLKQLANLVIALLNGVSVGNYYYEVQQQSLIWDPESNSHFVNIRLNFYAINLN